MNLLRTIPLMLLIGLMFCATHARAQAPICYAAPGGNDLNDGSYWAFAKADVMACYDALPSRGGTIFVADGGGNRRSIPACKSTDPPGCGIWILGYGDPNYANPPAGWRLAKSNVSIVGVGNNAPSFAYGGAVTIDGGGGDTNHPVLWLFTSGNTMQFKNLNFNGCAPAKIGIDSTRNRGNLTSGAWGLDFESMSFSTYGRGVGCGPAVDIGSNSSWNIFTKSTFYGNISEDVAISTLSRSSSVVTVTAKAALPNSWATGTIIGIVGAADSSFDGSSFSITVTGANTFTYPQIGPNATSTKGYASSDQSQAVVMNPGSAQIQGFTYFKNDFFDFGGLKQYPGVNGEQVEVDDSLQENGYSPMIWVAGCVEPLNDYFRNDQQADQVASSAALRIDCPNIVARSIVVQGVAVDGPATLIGDAGGGVNPLLGGQYGLIGGHLIGQSDAARRGFSPVVARFPNIANSLTPGGIAAPDGTFNAAQVTTRLPGAQFAFSYVGRHAFKPGDIFICGEWVQAVNPPGYPGGNTSNLLCSPSGITWSTAWDVLQGSAATTNGEWNWLWRAFKVSSTSSTYPLFEMGAQVLIGKSINIYAPTLIYIPSGMIPDSEAIEMAVNLQAYRNDATSGQVSLLPGEQFKADSIQVGAGPTITSGVGPPKGAASSGSIYLRRDGASGTTFYIYEKDGWKAEF